eukprot:GHVU01041351.1.p1 GENE.GHVU01041351.1~~GHVU01041351.1.p1  ORF type:complete len:208 (+),score=42.12 GHVU01041351.1:147-770(+)
MPSSSSLTKQESGTIFYRQQLRHAQHLQSAALSDAMSPLQVERQGENTKTPTILKNRVKLEESGEDECSCESDEDTAELMKLFPKTWGQKVVKLVPDDTPAGSQPPLRLGIVLSGGQAPGGHNVIAGVYDAIKEIHENSQLFGFKNGPGGLMKGNYVEITNEFMDRYRNQGGFDMICSGRDKIEKPEQKKDSMEVSRLGGGVGGNGD